jgi:hypothetical protein
MYFDIFAVIVIVFWKYSTLLKITIFCDPMLCSLVDMY